MFTGSLSKVLSRLAGEVRVDGEELELELELEVVNTRVDCRQPVDFIDLFDRSGAGRADARPRRDSSGFFIFNCWTFNEQKSI